MLRRSHARLTLVLWISMSLFCAIGRCATAGTEPLSADPMTLIPADSLFCVRLNNLSGTMTKMDQFLTGMSPVGVSMLVPAQLAKLLGGTEPKGINMAGDFAVFGPLPGGETPNLSRIAILVPVSDYKQFLAGNPNVSPPDAEGISAIGSKEQPMFAAANMAGYALVTSASSRQALIEMKKLIAGPGATPLAKRLRPEEWKRAQTSPVWGYANIQTLSKTFGPTIQAKLQEAKKSMEATRKQGQFALGQAGQVLDMYAGMLNTLMQETQSVNLTLDPTPAAIRVGFVAAAVPNTEMAKVLQGESPAPDRKFMQYMEDGAVMNFILSVDPATWNRISNLYINILARLAGKDPSGEDFSKLKKLVTDVVNSLSGILAGSFSTDVKAKPPFRLQYVAGMKDPQAFYRMLEGMPAMLESGPIADIIKQMGLGLQFELKRKAEIYKDVAVDAVRVSIHPTDPNSQESKMLATVFGQGMEGRLAVVNNLLVYAIGTDPGTLVRKLIDQAKGDVTPPVASEVQAAMQQIPGAETAGFFVTYNYLRVLQMVAAIMPVPILQTPVQSQSNIALAGKATGGSLNVEIALPKQHVMEMMTIFMQMQQQKMQEQQRQQPQEQPQGQLPKQTSPGQT